jgi:hypothetical protein
MWCTSKLLVEMESTSNNNSTSSKKARSNTPANSGDGSVAGDRRDSSVVVAPSEDPAGGEDIFLLGLGALEEEDKNDGVYI